MRARSFRNISKFNLIIYFIYLSVNLCTTFRFDRDYFGVSVLPYVKDLSDGVPQNNHYTYDNVKTMLTVVSKKFTRILVKDTFHFYGGYIQNHTYHHGSYASLYAGEIAAKINRQNGNKTLIVLYQVREFSTADKSKTEILLALEAAERANRIFEGTVEGICFGRMKDMQRTLDHFQSFRRRASDIGIKLGTDLNCLDYFSKGNKTLQNILQQITNKSDFISCWGKYHRQSIGPENSWEHVEKDLMAFQHTIKKINPKTEVVANSVWSSSGLREWETVDNLRVYWETASEWASKNKYQIYMFEAFDNPGRKPPNDAHLGWWKLTSNEQINLVDGYQEKISELNISTTTPTFRDDENGTPLTKSNEITTILAGIGGASTVVLLIVLSALLVFRRREETDMEKLGEKDIRDFLLGAVMVNQAVLRGRASAAENAMNVPYDSSLEISKDKLKIDPNQLLGSGQFGFVFKGVIEVDEDEEIQVAVKVAKENCHAIGLKGLLSEIKIMTFLGKHENIVELKGAYTAELIHGHLSVATELCSHGSLESFLRNNMSSERGGNITSKCDTTNTYENAKSQDAAQMELGTYVNIAFRDMLRWAHEIACGMEYLERKQVVHADLATRNVLLSDNKTVKISDFGLSRRMYNYLNYVKQSQEPLPWRWMAIESLKRMEFSSKSDVWSYGVTLWEIFSKGDIPYPGVTFSQSFVGRLENGLRPNCPKFASPEIYNTMCDCWSSEPKERSTFHELVEIVNNLLPRNGRGGDDNLVNTISI